MSDNHTPHHSPSDESRFRPKAAAALMAALPDADRRQIEEQLRHCDGTRAPFLAHVLHHKLSSCRAVSASQADSDVVIGGCHVSYAIDGGPAQSGLLVHRARAGAAPGVIPVSSLIGATLIGMRVGQRAPLLCEDGTIVSLCVLNVTPPG